MLKGVGSTLNSPDKFSIVGAKKVLINKFAGVSESTDVDIRYVELDTFVQVCLFAGHHRQVSEIDTALYKAGIQVSTDGTTLSLEKTVLGPSKHYIMVAPPDTYTDISQSSQIHIASQPSNYIVTQLSPTVKVVVLLFIENTDLIPGESKLYHVFETLIIDIDRLTLTTSTDTGNTIVKRPKIAFIMHHKHWLLKILFLFFLLLILFAIVFKIHKSKPRTNDGMLSEMFDLPLPPPVV